MNEGKHRSFQPSALRLDSFSVHSAQRGEKRALFSLCPAGAGEALLIDSCLGVDLYGLEVADGFAGQRAVQRALQGVPGKLKSRAHVFVVDKDTPAVIVHPH